VKKVPFLQTRLGGFCLWVIVAAALVILAAAMSRGAEPPPEFCRVLATGSMRGTFDFDQLALVERVPYDQLRAGMIVVYKHDRTGLVVAHRLIARQWGWWVAKGDSNPRYDTGFVTRENYRFVAIPIGPRGRGPAGGK
jgi:signal peptidase I